jgi:hypothetical protein
MKKYAFAIIFLLVSMNSLVCTSCAGTSASSNMQSGSVDQSAYKSGSYSTASPTPTVSSLPRYSEDFIKGLVAASLGPYEATRIRFTINSDSKPYGASPSGPRLRKDAVSIHKGNGIWEVSWEHGIWQVDERNGAVAPMNDRAASIVAQSNTPY